jgi:hypothetical protein
MSRSEPGPDVGGGYLTGHLSRAAEGLHYTRRSLALKVWNTIGGAMPTDRGAAILEIGAGGCELAEFLAGELGYSSVEVLDRDEEVVALAVELGLRVERSTEPGLAILSGRRSHYDAVVMSHVLEHFPKAEVVTALTAVRGALAKGGALFVLVPNMGDPLNGLYYRYSDFTHEVGFTEESLRYVLEQAGFTSIEFLEPVRATRAPVRALQRLAQAALHSLLFAINLPNGRQMRRRTGPELAVRARSTVR